MDTDNLLSGDTSNASDLLPSISSSVNDMLAPIILLSGVVTVLFIVLYIYSMFRRRKLENALFAIQKNIAEMNERDKARSAALTPPSKSTSPLESNDGTIIASSDEPAEDLNRRTLG